MQDLKNNLDVAISLAPATRTATANGTGVDLGPYDAAMVVVVAGTITDGTHAIKLQESDDNSTFTDVSAADLLGSFTNITSASNNTVQRVGYIGNKRYIRVVSTVTGATTGGAYSSTIVRGAARKYPL